MNSECRIVSATVKDVPVILRLIRELAVYERLAHAVTTDEEGLRRSLFGDRPAAEVVLAYDGDQVVGFAVFFQNFSTFLGLPGLYLEDLFVLPEHRGRGFGRQLLTHLARIAVARGYGRMEWSVLDWNAPAIGFYTKLGAVPMDEWTVFRLTGRSLEALGATGRAG